MDEPSKTDSDQAQPLSDGPDNNEQHIPNEETNSQSQQPFIVTTPEPDCEDDIAGHSEATSATFSGAGENIESSIGIAPLVLSRADHEEHSRSVIITADPIDADDDW